MLSADPEKIAERNGRWSILRFPRPTIFEAYWLCAISMALLAPFLKIATGKSGFALIPLLNAAWAMLIFILLLSAVLSNFLKGKVLIHKDGAPLFSVILIMIAVGLGIGIVSSNSKIYIVSTAIYWLNWAMLLMVMPDQWKQCDPQRFMALSKILLWVSIFSIAIGGSLPNNIAILLLSVAAFKLMSGATPWKSMLYLVPIVLLGSSLNRAIILAAFAVFLVTAIIHRRGFSLIFLLVSVVAIFFFLSYGDISLVADHGTSLFRRLNEIQVLLSGVGRIDDIVALKQRFYEGQLVMQAFSTDIVSTLFGMGFGATLDMSASADDSVKWAALSGAGNVHNIHFLPYSLLFRSGLLGSVFMAVYVCVLLLLIWRAWKYGTKDPISIILLAYSSGALVNALPAANYFLTDFILGAALALASIRMKNERRAVVAFNQFTRPD